MFGEERTVETPGGGSLVARMTLPEDLRAALMLEVRLPAAASASWIAALASYPKRLEVLRGSLLLDGSVLHAGARAEVAAGRAFELESTAGGDSHFVCELKAGCHGAALAAAAELALKLARG